MGLRKKLKEVIEKRKALIAIGAKEGSLSEEQEKELEELKDKADNLRSLIKQQEELEKEEKDLADSEPDPDPVVRKAPQAQVKVTREDGHNKHGEYMGYSKEYTRNGTGEFLLDVAAASKRGGKMSERLEKQSRAIQGMNITVGSDGGFLVPSEISDRLFTTTMQAPSLREKCTIVNSSTGVGALNLVDETSKARGSRYGGIVTYWVEEGEDITVSKPKLRRQEFRCKKLGAAFYATDESLSDAAQLQTFATQGFVQEFGYEIDNSIFRGDGATQCHGVLNSPAKISIAKESGQAADSLLYNNLDKMLDRLLPESQGNSILMIHPSLKRPLRNVFTSPGSNSDFMPFLADGNGIMSVKEVDGNPVVVSQHASAPGDLGDISLLDMSYYLLFVREGIKGSSSMHVQFLSDQQVFKWTMRVDGMSVLNSPITDAHGSDTRSPFITLAERA